MTASNRPPEFYRIRIRGHLDPAWSACFDSLAITQEADGTTTLAGALKLNVIELLWKHLPRRVTHNHPFASVAALVAAVEQFSAEMDCQPATVLSVIGCAD